MADTFQSTQPPGQKLPFDSGAIYAVHASIYRNPGRERLQAFNERGWYEATVVGLCLARGSTLLVKFHGC